MSEDINNTTSEPVSTSAVAILAGDVLATREKTLVDQLAASNWEPLAKLKEALATYSEVRLGSTLHESQPPLPTCEACKHREQCEGIPAADRDCFNPVTTRSK